MSLTRHLKRLRAKPEHERRRLTLMWSVVAVSVVVLIWLVNLYTVFGPGGTGPTIEASAPSPFAQITNMVTDMTATIKYSSQ